MTREIPFFWPYKGISERFAFGRQPPNTARDGGNVVGMEADTDRIRGGSRPGHSKYVSGLVTAGADPVLDLGVVVGDDRQITYSEHADADIETEWLAATPGGGHSVDIAVDLTGRLYVLEGARDNAAVWPTSVSAFYVLSPEGKTLATVSVPVLTGTYLRRIEVDDDLNVYVATGLTNGNPQTLTPVTQANSRIFKYRPLVTGEYVLDWSYAPTMQTTGLGATSTIGTVCYVSNMVAKGVDLYVTISDEANNEAECHKYEQSGDTTAPDGPDVSFGVEYQAFGLAIRDDGHVFVSSVDGADVAGTSYDGNEQYLTKYEPDGTQIWQQLASTTPDGGIGFFCALDSKNNIYTIGPRESSGFVANEKAWLNYWIDEGGSVRKSWDFVQDISGGLIFKTGFMRLAVDANDNVYIPWPGLVTLDWQVAAFDRAGTELFTFPGVGVTSGEKQIVALPPTMPDYGNDPVTISEFVYFGGTTFNESGTTAIISSTDATPIVVTVGSTALFSDGDEVQVDGHLVNLNVNGRHEVKVLSGTTLELQNTKGNGAGAGGATGNVEPLGAVKKIKLVTSTPTSGSTRTQKVLAVAGGAIKIANVSGGTWDDPTKGSTTAAPALSAASEYISAVTLFRQRFFTDSVNYFVYDLATDTVAPFVANLGVVEPRCKLFEAWNGRLVAARSADDPHGWFMSRAGNPYDWDYFPRSGEVDPTTPAAGTNSDAGRIEDVINGLIPWNDQLLFFMCDHQIWRMTNDPMDNGRVDNVSKTVGMAFGAAWARDPNGVLYFYSVEGGVYRMAPTSLPERISVGWIEKRLRDVDLTSRLAKLAWNYTREGLEIFLTARDGAGATQQEHYFWEQITGAWYPVTFSNVSHEPSSVLVLDGDAPGDRVRLVGCEDGYVRKQDTAELDDDGSAIDSFIILGPYALPGLDREIRLVRGQITLSNTIPGGVNWKLYSTDKADTLGAPVAQGHVQPGRSRNIFTMRGRGEMFFLELRSNAVGSAWALEKGVLSFELTGSRRRARV